MPFTVTTDMDLIAEDFALAAEVGIVELQRRILNDTTTEAVLERYALLDRLVPVGREDRGGTHLRDSKRTDPVVITGASVERFDITTRLTKTIPVGPDKESVPLYYLLVHDRQPYDIYPVAKKALFWEGAEHPVTKVHMPFRPADTWGEEAQAESLPREIEMFTAAGKYIAYSVVGMIGE